MTNTFFTKTEDDTSDCKQPTGTSMFTYTAHPNTHMQLGVLTRNCALGNSFSSFEIILPDADNSAVHRAYYLMLFLYSFFCKYLELHGMLLNQENNICKS